MATLLQAEQGARSASIAAVLGAMALVVTDAALVNVGLPELSAVFSVPTARSVAIVSAYQAALLIALLPAAAIGEAVGLRRLFRVGLCTFIGGSLVSATAGSFAMLIAARFVQGTGAAAIMALGIALLRRTLPADQLGRAIGWNALTVALFSAIGPAAGGFILTFVEWRWLFVAHLPLGLLALLLSGSLPADGATKRSSDLTSVSLTGASFAAIVAGLGLAQSNRLLAIALAASGICGLLLLARRERFSSSPVIPFDLLALRSFRLSFFASICCFVAQIIGMVALPFLLHEEFRLTNGEIGLTMVAWPAAVGLAGLVSGRLADRWPTAILMSVGATLMQLGLAGGAFVRSDHYAALILCMLAAGCGFGLFQVPNNRNLFLSAPPQRSGAAGGLQSVARLSGQAIGAAAVGAILSTFSPSAAPRIALATGAIFALAAAAISLWHARVQILRAGPVREV